MISHQYKCIFVHIPRCAGTSVEKWICGEDWWKVEPATKHLLASQAKKLYRTYWDDYFTFSIVRNPWDRMVSCLRYPDHFGVSYKDTLCLDTYKIKFGYPVVIENDHRFSERNELVGPKHQEKCVYQNILDEELDFVGRYESLQHDLEYVQSKLKIEQSFAVHLGRSERDCSYQSYYNEKSITQVKELYQKDIERYEYQFR